MTDTDTRHLRRLQSTPEYIAAQAIARVFVHRLAALLSEHLIPYEFNSASDGLNNIGGGDVQITTRPGLLGCDARPDGETFCLRLYGPRPERAIHYAHNVKDSEAAAQRFCDRVLRITRRSVAGIARRHQPTVQQAAQQRILVGQEAFGQIAEVRILSGTQVRADLPGGARLEVYGEKNHDMLLRNLSTEQLRAALHAVAATMEPHPPCDRSPGE